MPDPKASSSSPQLPLRSREGGHTKAPSSLYPLVIPTLQRQLYCRNGATCPYGGIPYVGGMALPFRPTGDGRQHALGHSLACTRL